jgi:hypothetical protein
MATQEQPHEAQARDHEGEQAGAAGATPGSEAQLALIEQAIGRALSAEERGVIARKLARGILGQAEAAPFVVPDGTEPGFVFRPLPGGGNGEGRIAPDGNAHG